jgi:hypothetical protein
MTRIRLTFAAVAALLLWPAVALAQNADTPPAELVSALFASWGQWSVSAGLVALIAVQVWRKVRPGVWESLPALAKRLLPPTVSALTTGAVGLAAGGSWAEAVQVFVAQWIALAWAADVLTGLVGKGTVTTSGPRAEVKSLPANARRPGKPPIPPPAAMVFLLAFGLGGCSVLRPAVNAIDSVCALGLESQPLVQAAADAKGWPLEQTASWLCGFPGVFDAWDAALNSGSRQDPAQAAVREAQRLGLL